MAISTWEEDIVQALKNLGGLAQYSDIYSEISQIRQNLPQSWKQIIQRNIQDLSSDSDGFKGKKDIFYSVDGLGAGVWGLRSYLSQTPKAIDLPTGIEQPERSESTTYRILRDTELARKIKLLHNNECQLCGLTITLSNNQRYSEAHHIIPLGRPHNGSDTADNIIVLCPNHHVMCDYGVIKLEIIQIKQKVGHSISEKSIVYHNSNIFN